MFKGVSVNAEKWLPMRSCDENGMPAYIQTLKEKGYTIVGVEQTANSKGLVQYEFPRKTVLVLGRERDGIPATLLHMLDDCVEIPQFGMTRYEDKGVGGWGGW